MASSILEQYRISDILEWIDKKTLVINRDFQRRSVWTPTAQIYLIDTILRELPIPKIYMRTMVDLKTKKSYREVVDGQQRILTISRFAQGEITLSSKAKEFAGMKYTTLGDELQEKFLSYPISVGQLINASIENVIDIFARLNSYTVRLNNQELRHAHYQGDFKWAVFETSKTTSHLFDKHGVLTTRQRVRMLDDQLVAELFGVLLKGIGDGGQNNINRLYKNYDRKFTQQKGITDNAIKVIGFIFDNFSEIFFESPAFATAPHFLMLFAAVAHILIGIPSGKIEDMPRKVSKISNIKKAKECLSILANVIEGEETPDYLREFSDAASSSTQGIASRKVRFPIYFKALIGELD